MTPSSRKDQLNIFYTESTNEFHQMCSIYSIYGSFHPPKRCRSINTNDENTEEELSPFINLVCDGPKSRNERSSDAWIDNAERIFSSICQIDSLLESNSLSYTNKDIFTRDEEGPSLSENDVAIFESSIASFMTSTASQIDTLRQSIADSMLSENMKAHRKGIISHLVSQLREIMENFRFMQSVRNREELDLYRDPFKCCYYKDDNDDVLNMSSTGIGNEFEPDEEYLDMLEREEEEFQAHYNDIGNNDEELLQKILSEPLPTLSKLNQIQEIHVEKKIIPQTKPIKMKQNPPKPHIVKQSDTNNLMNASVAEMDQNQAAILQQEQIFLTAKAQNTKLDAAHKVESQMMQITSLLSQFSALITEQQEEIQVIADSTAKSRDNMDKGREQLVQATEHRKNRKHYFAWVIFGLGLFLLFLNFVLA